MKRARTCPPIGLGELLTGLCRRAATPLRRSVEVARRASWSHRAAGADGARAGQASISTRRSRMRARSSAIASGRAKTVASCVTRFAIIPSRLATRWRTSPSERAASATSARIARRCSSTSSAGVVVSRKVAERRMSRHHDAHRSVAQRGARAGLWRACDARERGGHRAIVRPPVGPRSWLIRLRNRKSAFFPA